MQTLYDYDAPKKAKLLKINLPATLEQTLSRKLAKVKEAKWAKSNKQAIKAYNNFVEEHGCFSDDYREF